MLKRFLTRAQAFLISDINLEDGQTTVEYAIILALVILLAIAAFGVLDGQVDSFMSSVGATLINNL